MENPLLEFFSIINSPDIQAKLLFLKAPLIMVAGFAIGIILNGIFRTTWLECSFFADAAKFISARPYGYRKIGKQWRKLVARLETGNEAEYKLAIIEADTILDETLKKMNLKGESLDERLQGVTSVMIGNSEGLKNAHQIRNNLVYDPDYRLSLAEARRVLDEYAAAFRGLDLMQ